MNRTQFLCAAQNLQRSEHPQRTTTLHIFSEQLHANMRSVASLLPAESAQLSKQVKTQLARERRRCRAHSGTYDAGRHIRLYLLTKALS